MITITTNDGKISLQIEGVIEESHGLKSDVTKNPVASGANVSDNIILQPRTYNMEARISPFVKDYLIEELEYSYFLKSKWNEIKGIWISKQLVTIETDLDTYENMCILSIVENRNSSNAFVLDFSATIQEVFMVGAGTDPHYSFESGATENQGVPIKEIGYKMSAEITKEKALSYQNEIAFDMEGSNEETI